MLVTAPSFLFENTPVINFFKLTTWVSTTFFFKEISIDGIISMKNEESLNAAYHLKLSLLRLKLVAIQVKSWPSQFPTWWIHLWRNDFITWHRQWTAKTFQESADSATHKKLSRVLQRISICQNLQNVCNRSTREWQYIVLAVTTFLFTWKYFLGLIHWDCAVRCVRWSRREGSVADCSEFFEKIRTGCYATHTSRGPRRVCCRSFCDR